MSLYDKLRQRAAGDNPIRIGLIGAGKFGSMYLAQVPRTPGVHLAGIADLSPDAARANLARVGWSEERMQARSLDAALEAGTTHISEDWEALVRHPRIDVEPEGRKSRRRGHRRAEPLGTPLHDVLGDGAPAHHQP